MPTQNHGLYVEGQDSNNHVLQKSNSRTMYAMLSERRLRWLGHVSRMEKGRIPKDLLYGQLECDARSVGRPKLRFKDSCKRDMISSHIDDDTWETTAADRPLWRHAVKKGIGTAEEDRKVERDLKRERRKLKASCSDSNPLSCTKYVCKGCNKDCHSRIGLFSHLRRC